MEAAGVSKGAFFHYFSSKRDLGIAGNVQMWRDHLMPGLEAALQAHPPALEVDVPSLADQVFTIFEGAFILARATGDSDRVRAQLVHLRHYLELLFRTTRGCVAHSLT